MEICPCLTFPHDIMPSSGPTFLDNVCLHLASSLLGAAVVSQHLRRSASSTSETQLYWRSPVLTPLPTLLSPTSPVISTDAQSRLVFVDLTISFLPPNTTTCSSSADGGTADTVQIRPRVRAKFGALVRSWDPIQLSASGNIDRTCPPVGGTYIRQSNYVTKRGLREYGEGISIDLDSMESRPTAQLLGRALRGDGLHAEAVVVESGKDEKMSSNTRSNQKVIVTLDHLNLGEQGSFAIVGDSSDGEKKSADDNNGHLGELAMKMMLANLQATESDRYSSTAASAAAEGDAEEENELRRVFEGWWKRASGDVRIGGDSSNTSVKSAASSPVSKFPTINNDLQTAAVAGKKAAASNAVGIGGDSNAASSTQLESVAPESKPIGAVASTQNDAARPETANGGEHKTHPPANSSKENQNIKASASAPVEPTSNVTTTSPPKKKRKAPGPILVRAGGGSRKKKKGKITIGK